MTEDMWFGWDDPRTFLQSLAYLWSDPIHTVFSPRRLRLFAVACGRRVLCQTTDPRLAAAIEAAEIAADARTNADRAQFKESRRSVWANVNWRGTTEGRLARALTGRTELTAAIEASWYASYLIGGATMHTEQERIAQGPLLRDIIGNPFRPVAFPRNWRTDTAVVLARQMYESRDFGAMPILADALQDAGCDSDDVLNHCRDTSATHVRGCWVVDLVLNKT